MREKMKSKMKKSKSKIRKKEKKSNSLNLKGIIKGKYNNKSRIKLVR